MSNDQPTTNLRNLRFNILKAEEISWDQYVVVDVIRGEFAGPFNSEADAENHIDMTILDEHLNRVERTVLFNQSLGIDTEAEPEDDK